MAVEGHGGLQPQGIPGPPAAGEGPGGRQRVPKGGGVRRGAVELKAVLAGVPGAGDQAGPAVHRAVEHGGVVLRRKVRRQGAQQRLRTGPLEGELGRLIGEILQSAVPGQVGGHPIPVLADVGGVDHRQPGRVRTAVDDQIVHHASVLVAHGGIAGLAVRHAGKVVGHEPVEVGQGVGAPEEQLSHVADVEQAAAGAHGPMLGDDAGVLHRQQPSGKGNQLAPRRRVAVVERSFAFHFHALL